MTPPKHFLDLDVLDAATLRAIVDMSKALKDVRTVPKAFGVPQGAVLAMIFEKPSTRTRVSFEVAIHQLGGTAIVLNAQDMQLGRGETIADTARVLSRYVDAIMVRTGPHETLEDFAAHAAIPVINGLTARSHPCQIMADILTFEERKGPIKGRTVAWLGDANNVAASWVHAAVRFGFTLRMATPSNFAPASGLLTWAEAEGASIEVTTDASEAARSADCVVTDTWVSMGDNDEGKRKAALQPFRVDDALMGLAKPDAIFMHCLPAHRGDEVTDSVIDGPQSAVWDEAENRLHAQKAILAWCLGAVAKKPKRKPAKRKLVKRGPASKQAARKVKSNKSAGKAKAKSAAKNKSTGKKRTHKKSDPKSRRTHGGSRRARGGGR